MSREALRNIAIILVAGLAVAFVPGGSAAAQVILGVISMAFLAAIGFLGYRLYIENRFTLWGMSLQHRALLYGGIAFATATLIATSRLWASGLGTILWFIFLGGSAMAVWHAWTESRRYGV
jgi:hypothetical protein